MLSNEEREHLFLSFQMMSVSAAERIRHLSESRLALSHLLLAYWQHREISRSVIMPPDAAYQPVSEVFEKIEPDATHRLDKEYRRLSVVASFTTLDTFLSDLRRFLFLVRPQSIPEKHRKLAEEDLNEAVRRSVKDASFGGYKSRLESIQELFKVEFKDLSPLLSQLQDLVTIRNEITHDSALYEYSHDKNIGTTWTTPKPLPEVSFYDAMNASMIITEVIDIVFITICREIFEKEPTVRPLIPEVAAVHASLRKEWDRRRNSAEDIHEDLLKGWLVRTIPGEDRTYYWVVDTENNIIIQPTGIERSPLMISYTKHNYHGKIARLGIDGHDALNIESSGLRESQKILDMLLHGKELWIEYHEWPDEQSKRARGSLAGFPEAWDEATRKTPRIE